MRITFVTITIVALALMQAGCAAGFRAGGRDAGVGVGAAVGPAPPVFVAPQR